MTENLLWHPAASYHQTSLERPGAEVDRRPLNPVDNLNLLIVRVHTALQEDQTARLAEAQARGLKDKSVQLLKQGAGIAINAVLFRSNMPVIPR